MKDKTLSGAMLLLLLMIASGCNDRFHFHPVTEDRTAAVPGAFSGVSLDGAGNVSIRPGGVHGVAVTADMDVIGGVVTEVDTGHVLRVGISGGIKYEDGKVSAGGGEFRGGVYVKAHTPELSGIAMSGHGKIKVGAGVSGGGHLMIIHTGAGDIDAGDYQARAVTVIHTGSGSIRVRASDTLFVSITTRAGEVLYAGAPVIKMFDYTKAFAETDGERCGADTPCVNPPPLNNDGSDEHCYLTGAGVPNLNVINRSGARPQGAAVSGQGEGVEPWLDDDNEFRDRVRAFE